MSMTLLSATVLIILVMDPLGNVPLFIALLRGISPERQAVIILREVLFAFLILTFFLVFGPAILALLHLSPESIQLAGGTVLFLIALKMIFPPPRGLFGNETEGGEPFLFPLAVPLIAGPSAVATVMLFAAKEPDRMLQWLLALTLACSVNAMILRMAPVLNRVLGQRVLHAVERLMGLLLSAIAVELIVQGLRELVAQMTAH